MTKKFPSISIIFNFVRNHQLITGDLSRIASEPNRLSRGVAVEGKVVDSAAGDAGELVLGRGALDVGAELSGGLPAEEGEEVGTETSDVGAGHGGTRDGAGGGGGADPGGEDVGAGSEDVDDGAVVGEAGAGKVGGGGTDSAGEGLVGGGGALGVGVLVAGGDGEEVAGVDDGTGSRVDGAGGAAAKRHVDDGAVGAGAGPGVSDDKVHASDDARGAAGSRSVEDLDGVELGLLGNTIGSTTDGAGDVGTVAVAIRVAAVNVVGQPGSTALEVLVVVEPSPVSGAVPDAKVTNHNRFKILTE